MATSSHTVVKAYIALRSRYVYLFEAFRGEEHSCAATDHRVKEAGGQQRPAAAARIMHACFHATFQLLVSSAKSSSSKQGF